MTVKASTFHGRVIILSCFGRGGSSVVWRMIGSSPDVIMTTEEWHVAVFGRNRILRKASKLAFQVPWLKRSELLRRRALACVLSMRDMADAASKAEAVSCVVKVMDYHLVFSEMIRRSFTSAKFVVLTRHPYGLCESLMRSGLSLGEAAKWYTDVASLMAEQLHAAGTVHIRFEDVIGHPMQTCDRLYASLGVRWADDKQFLFKIKPYGAQRTAMTDVTNCKLIRIGAKTVGDHIDAAVLAGPGRRLSRDQRQTIWRLTGQAAAEFGYEADPRVRTTMIRGSMG